MKRGFVVMHKAYYASGGQMPEILLSIFEDGEMAGGEVMFRWYEMGKKLIPRLEAYDDAWKVLSLFKDLVQDLGNLNDANIPPESFVTLLKSRGFVDMTSYHDLHLLEDKKARLESDLLEITKAIADEKAHRANHV